MLREFVRDESGIAMGLAVIMILLIGVMGAGLLVFIRNDLEAVVEVNQGQKALEVADAGIQAAEAHLKLDANPRRYDGEATVEDSGWSYSRGGEDITLEGDRANIEIRFLRPAGTEEQARSDGYAPETLPAGETEYPGNRSYFNVTSEGVAGNARRVVESIYYTRETGLPAAWYSTGTFDWNGDAFEVSNVSVFSGENVTDARTENIRGCDLAYGDWYREPWNETRRPGNTSTATCPDGFPAGIGTVGNISYSPPNSGPRPGIDYDAGTAPPFVPNAWTGTSDARDVGGEISYPFNPDPDSQVDLDVLRAVAASDANGSRLETLSPGETFTVDDYPGNANENTVYFIEFANPDGTYTNGSGVVDKGDVVYRASASLEESRGTIVVVNGDFTMSGNREYGGLIVLRDPVDDDGETLDYTNTGNVTLGGFANVEGTVTMSGSVEGSVSSEVSTNLADGLGRRPGFYTLERWSWRECYSEDCG